MQNENHVITTADTIFDVYQPRRHTQQFKKDFINDQESSYGSSLIKNMLHNALSLQLSETGTIFQDEVFKPYIFEPNRWDTLSFLQSDLKNFLARNFNFSINEVDISYTNINNNSVLFIKILFTYGNNDQNKSFEYYLDLKEK